MCGADSSPVVLAVLVRRSWRGQHRLISPAWQATELEDEAGNFRFTVPAGYREVAPTLGGKGVAGFVTGDETEVSLTIRAGSAPADVRSAEDVLAAYRLYAVIEDESVAFSDPLPYAVNGVSGLRFKTHRTMGQLKLEYQHWIAVEQGFQYHLTAYAAHDLPNLSWHATDLFDHFSPLSASAVAVAQPLSEDRIERSFDAGYSVRFADDAWKIWTGGEENLFDADFLAHRDEAFFVATASYCPAAPVSHAEALDFALFRALDIRYPDYITSHLGEVTVGDGVAQGYRALYPSSDGDYEHLVYRVSNGACEIVIALWSQRDAQALADAARPILASFQFHPVETEVAESVKRTAWYDNAQGLFYYASENYPLAAENFGRAAVADPSDIAYLTNHLVALNDLGRNTDGLAAAKVAVDSHPADPDLLSWKAWYEYQTGDMDATIDTYRAAFANGRRAEEDLLVYSRAMISLGEATQALADIERYQPEETSRALENMRIELTARSGDVDGALAMIQNAQKDGGFDPETALTAMGVFHDLGQFDDIVSLGGDLVERGHASARVHYEVGDAHYRLEQYVQARQSFQTALEMSPGNREIEEYLRYASAQLGQGDVTLISQAIEPVAMPDIAFDDDYATQTGHHAVYPLRAKAFEYRSGKPVKATTRRRIRVLDQAAVEDFSTLEASFASLSERLYINRLDVIGTDGSVVSANRDAFYVSDDTDHEQSTYNKVVRAPVRGLKPGDTIEFVFTVESLSSASEFPFEKVFLGGSRPMDTGAVFVTGDIESIAVHASDVAQPVRDEDSLLWVRRQIAPIESEPLQVEAEAILPFVALGSQQQDWSELGVDYVDSIADKLVADDPQLTEIIESLSVDGLATEEKLRVLTQYVQQTLTYKPIEFGTRGRVPNDAATILSDRFGDCKDHSVLLWALIQRADIPAHLALANFSGPVVETLPSLNQFDHMIVYVPGDGDADGYFLDATNKDMDLLAAAPMALGNTWSLILDDAPALKKIPSHQPSSIVLERTVQGEESGAQRVEESIALDQYFAAGWRSQLKSVEGTRRLSWAQSFLAQYRTDIVLQSFDVENLNRVDKPLVMRFDYLVHPTTAESDEWEVASFDHWARQYFQVTPDNRRTSAFQIRYPFRFRASTRIVTNQPKSHRWQLPDAVEETSEFGRYHASWTALDSAIHQEFEFAEQEGRYSPSEFSRYELFSRRAIAALSTPVRQLRSAND